LPRPVAPSAKIAPDHGSAPPRCIRNVPEFVTSIEQYVANHNRQPKAFIWAAEANDIPAEDHPRQCEIKLQTE
jgi:hypothetical protein